MASSMVAAGVALASVGLIGRYIMRTAPNLSRQMMDELQRHLPKPDPNSRYHRGGFEQRMSRREAGLVLGVSANAGTKTVKQAHKRVMLANHPDRGGSPYLAAKINEAKDLLESNKSSS